MAELDSDIRAFVPSGTPLLAVTATVTKAMRLDICNRLEMTKLIMNMYTPLLKGLTYYIMKCIFAQILK